jgi:hypothetical protein
MTAIIPLGKFECVPLTKAWPTEDGNFTPWLAGESVIGLLGEALGMELEVEAVEHWVGSFRYTRPWADRPQASRANPHIALFRQGVDPADPAQRQDLHAWMLDRMERFRRVFAKRIRALAPDVATEDAREE